MTDRGDGVMVLQAPAKVNLFLEVLAKRPDGFHAIETLMIAVDLFDTLEIMAAPKLSLTCSDPSLSTGADNLVLKAATVLQRRTGYSGGAKIHLQKTIPAAAGLAGGSSDAATTLIGLNELWKLGLSRERLGEMAAEIGSDVAFFLFGPAAWCLGRGEIVTPTSAHALDLVLIAPAEGLKTADVFRRNQVHSPPRSSADMRLAFAQGDVAAIGRSLFNRLQEPAEELCPMIRTLSGILSKIGPPGHLMSGSGSTLFALCAGREEATQLAARLRPLLLEPTPRVFVVRSCMKT